MEHQRSDTGKRAFHKVRNNRTVSKYAEAILKKLDERGILKGMPYREKVTGGHALGKNAVMTLYDSLRFLGSEDNSKFAFPEIKGMISTLINAVSQAMLIHEYYATVLYSVLGIADKARKFDLEKFASLLKDQTTSTGVVKSFLSEMLKVALESMPIAMAKYEASMFVQEKVSPLFYRAIRSLYDTRGNIKKNKVAGRLQSELNLILVTIIVRGLHGIAIALSGECTKEYVEKKIQANFEKARTNPHIRFMIEANYATCLGKELKFPIDPETPSLRDEYKAAAATEVCDTLHTQIYDMLNRIGPVVYAEFKEPSKSLWDDPQEVLARRYDSENLVERELVALFKKYGIKKCNLTLFFYEDMDKPIFMRETVSRYGMARYDSDIIKKDFVLYYLNKNDSENVYWPWYHNQENDTWLYRVVPVGHIPDAIENHLYNMRKNELNSSVISLQGALQCMRLGSVGQALKDKYEKATGDSIFTLGRAELGSIKKINTYILKLNLCDDTSSPYDKAKLVLSQRRINRNILEMTTQIQRTLFEFGVAPYITKCEYIERKAPSASDAKINKIFENGAYCVRLMPYSEHLTLSDMANTVENLGTALYDTTAFLNDDTKMDQSVADGKVTAPQNYTQAMPAIETKNGKLTLFYPSVNRMIDRVTLGESPNRAILDSIIYQMLIINSLGITHGDFHMGNIIFDVDQKHVKIIDFDMARLFEHSVVGNSYDLYPSNTLGDFRALGMDIMHRIRPTVYDMYRDGCSINAAIVVGFILLVYSDRKLLGACISGILSGLSTSDKLLDTVLMLVGNQGIDLIYQFMQNVVPGGNGRFSQEMLKYLIPAISNAIKLIPVRDILYQRYSEIVFGTNILTIPDKLMHIAVSITDIIETPDSLGTISTKRILFAYLKPVMTWVAVYVFALYCFWRLDILQWARNDIILTAMKTILMQIKNTTYSLISELLYWLPAFVVQVKNLLKIFTTKGFTHAPVTAIRNSNYMLSTADIKTSMEIGGVVSIFYLRVQKAYGSAREDITIRNYESLAWKTPYNIKYEQAMLYALQTSMIDLSRPVEGKRVRDDEKRAAPADDSKIQDGAITQLVSTFLGVRDGKRAANEILDKIWDRMPGKLTDLIKKAIAPSDTEPVRIPASPS